MRTPYLLIIHTLLVLSLFACTATSHALEAGDSAGVVVLGAQEVDMAGRAQMLEDRAGTLTAAQAAQTDTGWRRGSPKALSFGFTTSSWWLRWHLHNPGADAHQAVIDLGSPRQDYADWYLAGAQGGLVAVQSGGDRRAFSNRSPAERNPTLTLTLAPGERVTLLLRLASFDGLYEALPIRLYTPQAHRAATDLEDLLLTLFHGSLLALALYNLLVFAATRESSFGLYTLYVAAVLAWSLTFNGYAFKYLWPDAPRFNNDVLTVFAALSFAGFTQFSIVYLRMHALLPGWAVRLNQSTVLANLLIAVPAFAGWYAIGAGLGMVTGLAATACTLVCALVLLVRGVRPARFLVLAFATLAIGVSAYIGQVAGVLPVNFLSRWGIPIGSSLEVLLLALGLADSMNMLKAQKLAAEREARQQQEQSNRRLEFEVAQRTQELERANQRLRTLSITDELTGAFNRRHFNEYCDVVLAQQSRNGGLGFCMIDVDHFKAYNDHYGHQAGDDALHRVAATAQYQLRRAGDRLFRLGGEEFGVIFSAADGSEARAFAQQLCDALFAQDVEHAGSPLGRLSVSIGVQWWPASALGTLRPEAMVSAADQALYRAKEGGRNRVEYFSQSGHQPVTQDA